MSNDTRSEPPSVQSVDRAITILEILARTGQSGITDIARELDVHKSTAFRLVASLTSRGLVEQSSERGGYRLGVGIVRLAGAATARLDVIREARPLVLALARDTGETVNIAVLSEGAALYVEQEAGSAALQAHNWVGQHIPLHATSNGKVLLSGLTDTRVADEVGRRLRSYTPTTVTSLPALLRQLADVRRDGYAVAAEELEPGLTAVAAPLRNVHGDVIASLSVSGAAFRYDEAMIQATIAAVTATASTVSARLGWHEPTVTPTP